MGLFKCIRNRDGVVVLVHSLNADGSPLGRITFDENERFAEGQIKEGEICTVSYSFSKYPEGSEGTMKFPEE